MTAPSDQELLDRAHALRVLIRAEAAQTPVMQRRAAFQAAAERLAGRNWEWQLIETIGGEVDICFIRYTGAQP